MATVSQVIARPVSGIASVDSLIGSAQPWNYIGRNVLYYTFSMGSGLEAGNGQVDLATRGAFNAAQQAATRTALAYVSQVTGIQFSETTDGNQADVHFANANLLGNITGLTSNAYAYQYNGSNVVTSLTVDSWVYLDSYDQVYTNLNPAPGTGGYETLLHELGHALGLKHPFEGADQLPSGSGAGQDNTGTTLMSYTHDDHAHSSFSAYDLAALDWLYGRDGLGGARGVNAAGKVMVGSVGADTMSSTSGDDLVDGGSGTDTLVYSAKRASYGIAKNGGTVTVTGPQGTDTVTNVERLKFADQSVNLGVGTAAKAIAPQQLNSLVELYIAYLNRVPDADGIAYWAGQVAAGQSMGSIGDGFYSSAMYFGGLTGYRPTMSNGDFINTVYKNVLGRDSVDASGMKYWNDALASGAHTRSSAVQTIVQAAHQFKGDAQYGWVADLLDNKIAVGKAFAVDQGLVFNDAEANISQGMAIAAAITSTSMAPAIALVGVTDALHLLA